MGLALLVAMWLLGDYAIAYTHVRWIKNASWFEERVVVDLARSPGTSGCCPAASIIYAGRYEAIDFRCCTHSTSISKLQPLGGRLWSSFQRNTSLLLVGDSLGEQHFLGLVCLAWAEGFQVEGPFKTKDTTTLEFPGKKYDWRAVLSSKRTRGVFLRFVIDFARSDTPEIRKDINYTKPEHVLVGGWHHGGFRKDINHTHTGESLAKFLLEIERQRGVGHISRGSSNHHAHSSQLLAVEPLPSHFPGGKYHVASEYPAAKSSLGASASCDDFSAASAPFDLNTVLRTVLHERKRNRTDFTAAPVGKKEETADTTSGFRVLATQQLYAHRGDAHIGLLPASNYGLGSRDCLHWCVAPGVLDALAMETLAAL